MRAAYGDQWIGEQRGRALALGWRVLSVFLALSLCACDDLPEEGVDGGDLEFLRPADRMVVDLLPPDLGPPEPEHPAFAVEMLAFVNEFRATGGTCGTESFPPVGPLALHQLLDLASQLHAEDMAEQGYFDHQSLDGRSPGDRITEVGYPWRAYGENIAAGQPNVERAFIDWVNSPGHCSNMLNGAFTELGVGYTYNPGDRFGHYWVQNFGTR